ncbi:IS4 family transposase [Pseudomonas fluorescens]|nr:IS4 family transposase [Pseudomonas fluorescens]
MFTSTRFAQMLQALPHQLFKAAVKRCGADRYAKQFTSWDLLVTLIYGQITQAKSLRTLATASQSLEPHRHHLNAKNMVRSTLCDALNKRSSEPFRLACEHLLKGIGRKQRKSLEAMITLIDSTSISLRGPGFDEWTTATKTRITQGLKVHVAIDPRQTAPTYVNITAANVNDLSDALTMPLEAGMTYVFDKGYCDYNWWHQIDQIGSFFVTRLKKRQSEAGRKFEKEDAAESIEADESVLFAKKYLSTRRPNLYRDQAVRRIQVRRDDHETPLVLVTNDFSRSAEEIAGLYKQRWQIELFFKWIKQNLKLKRYFCFSENAVRLQIYSALITYLLLHLYQRRSGGSGSISSFVIRLAHTLFERPSSIEHLEHRRQKRTEQKAAQGCLLL